VPQEISNESRPIPKPAREVRLVRTLATWGVVVGTALWTAFFFGYVMVGALYPTAISPSWFLSLLTQHPGGTLGVAIAAISAFSVVAVLDVMARDPLEIKVLGFELKGAAGPVVLWVMCFLVIVLGGHVLWDKAGLHAEPHILPSNSDASSITPAPSSNDSGN
jgi:hypothetical protein